MKALKIEQHHNLEPYKPLIPFIPCSWSPSGRAGARKRGKIHQVLSAHQSREGKADAGHLSCPPAEQIHPTFRIYCLSQYKSFPCPNPEAFAALCSESERIYHLCCWIRGKSRALRPLLAFPARTDSAVSIHESRAGRSSFCEQSLGLGQLSHAAGPAKEGKLAICWNS